MVIVILLNVGDVDFVAEVDRLKCNLLFHISISIPVVLQQDFWLKFLKIVEWNELN